MPSLDDIPTLPPANLSGDDMIAVIDGSDRRSPRQATLAQLGSSIVSPALAADPAGAREAMEAQSSARTFYDRFDDSSYYANGATITHAVSLPRVGAPWRLAVAANQIAPAVTIPPVSASSFQGEADDDSLTIAAGHSFLTKFPVRVTAGAGGLPAPLVENTTYYVIRISGTVIKLATSTANAIAGTAIPLTTDGGAAQSIRAFGMARGLTPSDGSGLFYLSSSVPSTNGRLTLGFEFTPVPTDQLAAALDAGLNISFHNAEMVPNSTGIAPEGVVHINIKPNGIQSADFYSAGGNIPLVCTNQTYAGSEYPWNSRGTSWATGRKQVIIFYVEGDYLRVICPGHGSLEFYHADISTRVGENTRFWWEPSGSAGPSGLFNGRKMVLHRVTDSLEQIQAEQWGSEEISSLSGQGESLVDTRLRLLGATSAWTSGSAPVSNDSYRVATPDKMRADKGFWSRPWSGYADYPIPLTSNLVSSELSSAISASNQVLLQTGEVPISNVGESLEFDITGTFAANVNSKQVQIYIATAGLVIADTGLSLRNGGTFRARLKRVYLTGQSHDYYGEISVTTGGVTTVYTGTGGYNNGSAAFTHQIRVSGTTAGDVRIRQGTLKMEVRQ